MHPFRDSTDLVLDGPGLYERMQSDGYVLLRRVIPSAVVRALHCKLAGLAQAAGWLAAGEAPAACIADPAGFCVDPEPQYLKVLEQFNRLVEFNAFTHHRALVGLFERMLGDDILVHPRPLPRNIFPGRDEYTTPAHQDYPNIQGTPEVYTAWIPLMDCGPDVGGLQVASGSHTGEVYDFGIGNGAGGIEIIEPFEGQWVGGPMDAGDVLVFHSMIVHKGVPNHSRRLRMSIDARYQRVSDPFNPDNGLAPYGQPATWDEVYASWPDTEEARALRYYWQRLELELEPFDPRWFDKRDQIGFELGERGDPRARSVLLRIVGRDRSAEKRARAQRLLDALDSAGGRPGHMS